MAGDSKYTTEQLKHLQSLPLEEKVQITIGRIIQWYNYWNGDVYVSFSGGKDSTVLLHLVRSIYPDVPAVFSNTGLEYPEIQSFAKSFDNVTVLRPKMRFDNVLTEFGYPLISKEVAEAIYYARRRVGNTPPENVPNCKDTGESHVRKATGTARKPYGSHPTQQRSRAKVNWRRRLLIGVAPTGMGGKGRSSCPTTIPEFSKSMFNKEKWLPLVQIPVLISPKCCNEMKKKPMNAYAKETGRKPIIGTMAEESLLRKRSWLRNGCNAFDGVHISSQPMSFWTEQDVLNYIKTRELELAAVYGDVVAVDKDGYEYDSPCPGCKLKTTGCQRTGCVYCPFGMHLEKGETRFQRLAKTHPKQYDYCMRGGAMD